MMYKVTHCQGDAETVYVVEAPTAHEAKEYVIEYAGLITRTGSFAAVACSVGDPIKLYTYDRKTGAMT